MKIESRIGSTLGTWTVSAQSRDAADGTVVETNVVIHLMRDPMRIYGCTMEGCEEAENEVCVVNPSTLKKSCRRLSDESTEFPWSDVSVFFYFDSRVSYQMNSKPEADTATSGWVGPYSIIFAEKQEPHQLIEESEEQQRHSYVSHYVQTPSSHYLSRPFESSLYSNDEDFHAVLGTEALNRTIHAQGTQFWGQLGEDPYYENSRQACSSDVQPLLPYIEFTFDSNDKPGLHFQHKLMSLPSSLELSFQVLPNIIETSPTTSSESKGNHFSLQGPYCYGNDPSGAFTFDISYNTPLDPTIAQETKAAIFAVKHGCIEGLPCEPFEMSTSQTCSPSDCSDTICPDASFDHMVAAIFGLYIVLAGGIVYFILICWQCYLPRPDTSEPPVWEAESASNGEDDQEETQVSCNQDEDRMEPTSSMPMFDEKYVSPFGDLVDVLSGDSNKSSDRASDELREHLLGEQGEDL